MPCFILGQELISNWIAGRREEGAQCPQHLSHKTTGSLSRLLGGRDKGWEKMKEQGDTLDWKRAPSPMLQMSHRLH